jgi:hypothetical protein
LTHLLVIPLSFVFAFPSLAHGQWRDAVAVSAPRESTVGPRNPVVFGVAPNEGTWQAEGFWRWTAVGLLAGAVAADTWVALQMASDSGDGSMIGPFIPLVIVGVAGGVGGGVIGAIAYTASHPRSEPSPQ